MTTDLEIARAAKMEPIEAVAWKLGISSHELMPMGNGVAKVSWNALKERFSKPQGSLVLVTSVNPTPFGEGKTVTTIGLTQALNRIGQSATCVIREPSMGSILAARAISRSVVMRPFRLNESLKPSLRALALRPVSRPHLRFQPSLVLHRAQVIGQVDAGHLGDIVDGWEALDER